MGKSDPVVDNCKTTNTSANNRPILPARATKNKIIIKKVKLTPIENNINIRLLSTFNWRNSNANTEINTACVTANRESFATLPVNHDIPDAGITAGLSNGTMKDIASITTMNASVKIYGAFESRYNGKLLITSPSNSTGDANIVILSTLGFNWLVLSTPPSKPSVNSALPS